MKVATKVAHLVVSTVDQMVAYWVVSKADSTVDEKVVCWAALMAACLAGLRAV